MRPALEAQLGKEHVIEYLTEYPRHAEALAADAVRAGVATVVACGGDGTISEVVNGMMSVEAEQRSQCALAVLPMGTGCDFVRTFGWSKSVPEAMGRLQRRALQPMDVGQATFTQLHTTEKPHDVTARSEGHRYFINIASLGISGKVCVVTQSTAACDDYEVAGCWLATGV